MLGFDCFIFEQRGKITVCLLTLHSLGGLCEGLGEELGYLGVLLLAPMCSHCREHRSLLAIPLVLSHSSYYPFTRIVNARRQIPLQECARHALPDLCVPPDNHCSKDRQPVSSFS